ncbi:MAG: YccF domain-containing protein [Clostridia bacterium]|nr:YccF domain-containing protein [Clostridia bacterium]
MSLIGNIIWILFGGWIAALLWLIFGAICCVTVIGIPFGLQCFKFAKLSFAPFGKHISIHPMKHPIANALWAVFLGWEMALVHLIAGLLCCVTIVGIPNGIVAFKMMKLSFLPFGAKVKRGRR